VHSRQVHQAALSGIADIDAECSKGLLRTLRFARLA
jgi:hypothetical protein